MFLFHPYNDEKPRNDAFVWLWVDPVKGFPGVFIKDNRCTQFWICLTFFFFFSFQRDWKRQSNECWFLSISEQTKIDVKKEGQDDKEWYQLPVLSLAWRTKMIYDNDIIVPPASPIRRSYSKDMNGTREITLLTCAHVEVILEGPGKRQVDRCPPTVKQGADRSDKRIVKAGCHRSKGRKMHLQSCAKVTFFFFLEWWNKL